MHDPDAGLELRPEVEERLVRSLETPCEGLLTHEQAWAKHGSAPTFPKRIQRKRTKGWKMPPNTVYVGRPTIYGNPFIGPEAAQNFRIWWHGRGDPTSPFFGMFPDRMDMLMGAMFQTEPHPIRGKNVACWCREDENCHGDTVLEVANA